MPINIFADFLDRQNRQTILVGKNFRPYSTFPFGARIRFPFACPLLEMEFDLINPEIQYKITGICLYFLLSLNFLICFDKISSQNMMCWGYLIYEYFHALFGALSPETVKHKECLHRINLIIITSHILKKTNWCTIHV